MHFGEFNPLEVLATAAVQSQREGNVAGESRNNIPSSNTDSELADNSEDGTDNTNNTTKEKSENVESNAKAKVEKGECSQQSKSNVITTTVSSSQVTTKELKPLSVITADRGIKGEPATPSYVIKMVTSNGNKVTTTRSVMALKDATKIVIPNKDGSSKTLTVLKINKPLGSKSNVSAGVICERPKGEDDEGYCSRSSLDSPGQCSRSDSELCENDASDLKSPTGTVFTAAKAMGSPTSVRLLQSDGNSEPKKSPVISNRMLLSPTLIEAGKKSTKIVIVSKDSNIKTEKEENKMEFKFNKPSDPVNTSQNGGHGAVLRSLLGEKSSVSEKHPVPVSSPVSVSKAKITSSKTVTVIPVVQTQNVDTKSKTVASETVLESKATEDVSLTNGSQHSGTMTQGTVDLSSSENKEGIEKFSKECKITNSNTKIVSVEKNVCDNSNNNCDNEKTNYDNASDLTSEDKLCVNKTSHVDSSEQLNIESVKNSVETPSTVVRIVCPNKTVSNPDSSSNNNDTSPVLKTVVTDDNKLETLDITAENVIINSSKESVTDETEVETDNSKKPSLKRSESFQNAFQSFLTSGKPVEVTEIKGTTVLTSKSDGSAILLPQSVLASLSSSQGGKITVVAGGPASQLVTSIASQVLATSQSLQLAQPASHVTTPTKSLVTKDEIIDVVGTNTKESLKLASSSNTQAVFTSISTTTSNNFTIVNSAISSKGNTAMTKTIPVLINTANGKRIANVPVSSLVSTNVNSQNNKPVTYLVMPPQGKGASLLLPPQFSKPQPPPVPKYQYIIQDDVPPVVSTASTQAPSVNIINMAKSALVPKTSDAWTLLATVDPQGMVVGGMSQAGSKSKTVPVLIKKPLLSHQTVATVVPQSSVLVSSKGPQSLIPRLVAPQLAQNFTTSLSQNNGLIGHLSNIKQENRLVNPNEVLRTQQTHVVTQGNSILDMPRLGKKSRDNTVTESHLDIGDLRDSKLIHTTQSSHNLEDADQSDIMGEVFLGDNFGFQKSDKNRSKTPVTGNGRITPLHSLESSPSENTINIKITGSKVIDMRTSEDMTMSAKKAATSIGKFGALSTSWGSFQKSESVPSFIGGASLTSGTSSPVYDSAASPSSSVEPWSPNPMSPLQIRSDSELDVESVSKPRPKLFVESNRAGHSYCKRKLRGSTSSQPDLTTMKDGVHSVSRLHPLIDHDYCMFSEFSADIQSSIIATTESKKKIEKYNQKAKAARTTKESLFKLEKNSMKMKKRKYPTRPQIDEIRRMRPEKASERPVIPSKSQIADALMLETNILSGSKIAKSEKSHPKKQAALDKKLLKPRMSKRRDGRNYVKITGSYQDDFVYYATKNSRGRPRKYHDATTPKPQNSVQASKKTPIGGINVFDWYRDLSKTDKSTKFGVSENPLEVKVTKADPYVNGISDSLDIPSVIPKGGQTPLHESDVADLVMQMMPTEEYNAASSEFAVPPNPTVAQSETVVTSGDKEGKKREGNVPADNPVSDAPVDLNDMAEQVRSLLNSLGEAELNMLTEELTTSDIQGSQLNENDVDSSQVEGESGTKECGENIEENDTSSENIPTSTADTSYYSGLNAFLGPYSQDNGPTVPQGTNASFDLDDINDSDLLTSDISNINSFLGDFGNGKSGSSDVVSSSDPKYTQSTLDSPVKSNVSLSLLFGDSPLKSLETTNAAAQQTTEKSSFAIPSSTESFQGIKTSSRQETLLKPISDINNGQRPPELTVVSMYWNDLPGLMINGKQCVRLVDIHKQMLPAKDTGILKKRCQMMNLEIVNCSELERDFLIRYANAAKSKSCVVVTKDDAQDLVSFYVNPRPRISSVARQSTSDSRESSAERLNDVTAQNGTCSSVTNEYGVDRNASPRPTGGKGKGKGKSRPSSVSSERASTPTGGKGKGKGGGKSSQRRRTSPQSLLKNPPNVNATIVHNTSPTVITVHSTVSHGSGEPTLHIQDNSGVKRSERTRNRKVNYAALNAGLYSDENPELVSSQLSPSEDSFIDLSPFESNEKRILGNNNQKEHKTPVGNNQKTIKMGRSLLNKVVLIKNSPVLKTNGMNNVTVNPVQGEPSLENRYNFQEEIEIRRLRNKQKRRGLNNGEKKKLKRLRERLRTKVKNLKRKIDTLKKNNGLALSPKKILIKSIKNAQARRQAILQQVLPGSEQLPLSSSDECFESEMDTSKTEPSLESLDSISPLIDTVKTEQTSGTIDLNKEGNPMVKEEICVKNEPKSEVMPENDLFQGSDVKQEPSPKVVEQDKKPKVKTEVMPKTKTETPTRRTEMSLRTPNRKVVFPVLHRSNQRGRVQVGNLHFHLYRTKDSSCIQCTTCSDFLSVKKFLKHLHHQNIADELCTVTIPQKLEMAILEPSEEQVYWWGEFEKKRDNLEISPQTSGRPSQRVSRTYSENKDGTPVRKQIWSSKVGNVNNNTVTNDSQGITTTHRRSSTQSTPVESVATGTRQSMRTRKRKQLHPIESYVYTNKSGQQNDSKRIKLEEGVILSPVTPVTPLSTVALPEPQAAIAVNNEKCGLLQSERSGASKVPEEAACSNNNTECVVENHIENENKDVLADDTSVTVG